MTIITPRRATLAGATYAALRYGGVPPDRACEALGLASRRAREAERLFRARVGDGVDAMRPKFARHETHVRAVMAQGGYPTLPRRSR